jgi:adenosine deaminase
VPSVRWHDGTMTAHPDPLATPLAHADLRALARAMPKAELHLHLDGSLRAETALELARSRGVDAPGTYAGMRAALVAPEQTLDQAELLRAFDLPIALLQDEEALERVAAELVEDKAADHVRYVEIRWGPLLHTAQGLSGADVVAATLRGALTTGTRFGVEVRLIATLIRSHDPAANAAFIADAARFRDDGLVGIDLAGPEARSPDPALHAAALARARAEGFHLTLHAGEWGGAAQVRRALDFDPERIAHGPGVADDPELLAEVRGRGIVLDLCPTSNVQAAIVARYEDHPLVRLHRAGVKVTLNTDDRTVSDIDLHEEYTRAVECLGMTLPELWAIDRAALDAAFCDAETRQRLKAAFEAWGEHIPELHEWPPGDR